MIVGESTVPIKDLPEMELYDRLKEKGVDKLEYNSGLAFSGGGGRAYLLALGAYKALHGLGILKKVRYTMCSSGGCWATAVYTYTKYGEDYFPEIKHPNTWTLEDVEGLSGISEGHRKRKGQGLFKVASSFGTSLDLGVLVSHGPWRAWNARHILKYAGIKAEDLIAADVEHAQYLRERLATLGLPGNVFPPRSDEFPYWIAGITLLGLRKLMPFLDPHSSQGIDASSLYVGSLHSHKQAYKSGNDKRTHVVEWTSGILETIAWGSSYDKGDSTWNNSIKGHHQVPHKKESIKGCLKVNVEKPFKLLEILSAASAAPAGIFSMHPAGKSVLPFVDYVSINAEPPYEPRAHKWYIGDTGIVADVPLYSLLQRKAHCVLAYVYPRHPLDIAWARQYIIRPDDPSNTPVINEDGRPPIDWSLAAFFGVQMGNAAEKGCGSGTLGCTLDFHQVFETRHLKDLVSAFVVAYDSGKALIHTMNFTTIANDRWGIAGGHHVRVTFVYSSVPKQWENDVQAAMRRIYKKPDWTWGADLTCRGRTFEQYYNRKHAFPFIPGITGTFKPICPLFASLIYQLAGSVVLDNQQLIKDALAHETCRADYKY